MQKCSESLQIDSQGSCKSFLKNVFVDLCKDLAFCIKRAGWKVTKIHSHITFEQSRFKQKSILMNQKSRQQSKNSIEKDFYKLMNNSNFGYDCRNNLDSCKFVSIFDEFKELTYINRYHNIFDPKVSQFVTSDLLKADVEEKYNGKLSKLDKEDRFYKTKLQTIKTKRLQQLEAAEKFEQEQKKKLKKTKLIDFFVRKNEALTNEKVKSLIDFDEDYSSSIRSVAIEKRSI